MLAKRIARIISGFIFFIFISLCSAKCMPGFNGLIEPTVVGGRVQFKEKRTGKEVFKPMPIF